MRRVSSYGPALIVLAAVAALLLAGPTAVRRFTHAHTRARIVQAAEGLDGNPVLEQITQAYRDIAALVEPSVVHISTERRIRDRWGDERVIESSGSGWIYDESGHIVTNYHVIQDAERIEVQLSSGDMRQAEVVGYDQFTDIALIRIPPGELIAATRAVPEEAGEPLVRQGDLVFAFGSPFDFRFSMSSGVVSGIGRYVGVIRDSRGRVGYENFIQVDAAINPGNSGGPLTDARGQVIGMNTAIATGRNNGLDEGQFAGIGLAIPIDMIEPVAMQIIETGSVQKGFLGVSVADRSRSVGFELGILGFRDYGVTVARIEPGNPAFEAGLRIGDVITHVDGEPVRTLRELRAATAGVEADDEVELAVWRYEPEADGGFRSRVMLPGIAAQNFRGIRLLQLDDTVSSWLEVLGFSGRGVRVASLEAGRPAREAGLRVRDVITHVNGEPVGSVAQLRSTISSMLPGDEVELRVWRYDTRAGRGTTRTLEVRLDRLDLMSQEIPREKGERALEHLGIARATTATPRLAEVYDVPFREGVLVEAVVEGSYVDGTIEPGSIIVSVMDQPVTSTEELFDLLDYFARGVHVTFVRPDGTRDRALLRAQQHR